MIIFNVIAQLQKKIAVKAMVTFTDRNLSTNDGPSLILEVTAKIKRGRFSGKFYSNGHSFSEHELRNLNDAGAKHKLEYIARRFNKGYQEKEHQP